MICREGVNFRLSRGSDQVQSCLARDLARGPQHRGTARYGSSPPKPTTQTLVVATSHRLPALFALLAQVPLRQRLYRRDNFSLNPFSAKTRALPLPSPQLHHRQSLTTPTTATCRLFWDWRCLYTPTLTLCQSTRYRSNQNITASRRISPCPRRRYRLALPSQNSLRLRYP